MMRLTKQSEIAIHTLALCARAGTKTCLTTRMAAAFANTTKDHAGQVVGKLVRAGYLTSVRGRAGGISLARPAARIRVGEVLRLMESTLDDATSRLPNRLSVEPLDTLQRAALDSFLSIFDNYTIADLADDPATSRIACLDCELHALFARASMRDFVLRRPARRDAHGFSDMARAVLHPA